MTGRLLVVVVLFLQSFQLWASCSNAADMRDVPAGSVMPDKRQTYKYHVLVPSDCTEQVCTGYFGHTDVRQDFWFPESGQAVQPGDSLHLHQNHAAATFIVEKVHSDHIPHYHLVELTTADIQSVKRMANGVSCACCTWPPFCAVAEGCEGDLCF